MKIIFKDFKAYLTQNGYTDSEVLHLFNAVQSMDKESRHWVVKWFNDGDFPQDEIEGVTAEYLVKECGYKPLNAFIVLDWLKTDPQAAKYFILRIPSTIAPGDTIGEEMKKYVTGPLPKPTPEPAGNKELFD